MGDDLDMLEARVRHIFRSAGNRARTIAQTAATPVFEDGQLMAFADAGLDGRSWLSRRDGIVRTGEFDHVEPDGQVQAVGDPFLVSGESLMYPGDPAGSAGNVINCRCTQMPLI